MTRKLSRRYLADIMGDDFDKANGLVADTVWNALEDVFDGKDIDEAVNYEVNKVLSNDDNIWKLLKEYQIAEKSNYNEMVDEFYDDVYVCTTNYIDEVVPIDEEE